jgi:hypothetical protein
MGGNANRFGTFIKGKESTNSSSGSNDKWTKNSLMSYFKNVDKHQNHDKRISLIDQGMQNIVFEASENTTLILKYAIEGLTRIKRSGKGLLGIIKKARILDDVSGANLHLCQNIFDILLGKLEHIQSLK